MVKQVRCKKDVYHENELFFKKGKTYDLIEDGERFKIENEQGDIGWYNPNIEGKEENFEEI